MNQNRNQHHKERNSKVEINRYIIKGELIKPDWSDESKDFMGWKGSVDWEVEDEEMHFGSRVKPEEYDPKRSA